MMVNRDSRLLSKWMRSPRGLEVLRSAIV